MGYELVRFGTRDEVADFAAGRVLHALKQAIAERGRANLMVSGGSTPGPLFVRLSMAPIAWPEVTVGLVDERWVPPIDSFSNERLVRSNLLVGRAGAAGFLPLWAPVETPEEAVEDRNTAYKPRVSPADMVLLGMGGDGHTASWFPHSKGLDAALSPTNGQVVAAIDATGCAGAGANVKRLTLTGPAVTSAGQALMLLFGDDKLQVLERARAADPLDMPVRHAIDGLGDRLTIVWAP